MVMKLSLMLPLEAKMTSRVNVLNEGRYMSSVNYGESAPGYGNAAASETRLRGEKHAQTSLILGIVGLFVLGIVLGPLALVQAKKAEEMHVAATAGKVLGWVDTICGALGIIVFILVVVLGVAGSAGS